MPNEPSEPKESAKPRKASNKTSKTARVLGLLSSPPPTEEPLPAKPPKPAKPDPAPAPEAQPETSVEAQVRSALEEELGGPFEPEPEPKPVPKPKPDPKTVPAPAMPEVAIRVDHPAAPQICCYNIMQALVEEKADKYIHLFGLCSCPRCRVDVIALSLTNLPAKYVVVSDEELVPFLSMYEAKYNAVIVSQVMNACKQVMEHPRHHI